MKAYGLPRDFCVAYPDPYDGILYGLKSSALRLPGRGGDCKSAVRSSRRKRRARITWKRRARSEARMALRAFLRDAE